MAEPRERHLGIENTQTKKLLIAIEDTGYAYTFYFAYLKLNYKDINCDIIGVGGADSFNNQLEKRYDYDEYIIIYDSGVEDRKLKEIRRALNNLRKNTDASIYIFAPKCFEEILLSFTFLDNYVKENKNTDAYKVYTAIQGMMNGGECVDYFKSSSQMMSEEKR